MTGRLQEPVPFDVTRWRCPWCGRSRSARAALVEHVTRCFRNPEARSCGSCANFLDYGGDGCACRAGLDPQPGPEPAPVETTDDLWIVAPEVEPEKRPYVRACPGWADRGVTPVTLGRRRPLAVGTLVDVSEYVVRYAADPGGLNPAWPRRLRWRYSELDAEPVPHATLTTVTENPVWARVERVGDAVWPGRALISEPGSTCSGTTSWRVLPLGEPRRGVVIGRVQVYDGHIERASDGGYYGEPEPATFAAAGTASVVEVALEPIHRSPHPAVIVLTPTEGP